MSSHLNHCKCVACVAPANIRHIIGRVCGYPDCCLQAYEKSALTTPKNKKQQKAKRKQKQLRKIQDGAAACIAQFWPCVRCADIILRRYKKSKDVVQAFSTVIQRPWGLTEEWTVPNDLDGRQLQEDSFNMFNDHAHNILSTADYNLMMDYLYDEHFFAMIGQGTTADDEKEVHVETTDDPYSFHWVTRPNGFRHKCYHELPKYCIPASDSES